MKLKLKKDIIIPEGTIFDDIVGSKSEFIYDQYDYILALDNDTCARMIVSSESEEYFEEVKNNV